MSLSRITIMVCSIHWHAYFYSMKITQNSYPFIKIIAFMKIINLQIIMRWLMDLGHVLITQTIFSFYHMVFNLFRFLKKPAIIVVKGEEVSYNEDLSFPTNFARSVSNMTKIPDQIAVS